MSRIKLFSRLFPYKELAIDQEIREHITAFINNIREHVHEWRIASVREEIKPTSIPAFGDMNQAAVIMKQNYALEVGLISILHPHLNPYLSKPSLNPYLPNPNLAPYLPSLLPLLHTHTHIYIYI